MEGDGHHPDGFRPIQEVFALGMEAKHSCPKNPSAPSTLGTALKTGRAGGETVPND